MTKDPSNGEPDNSPLILAGHSMGGLILERAMLHWVSSPDAPEWPSQPSTGSVELRIKQQPASGPDVVLLINPASSARDTKLLTSALRDAEWAKCTTDDKVSFQPPVVISLTSKKDWTVRFGFKFSNFSLNRDTSTSAGFSKAMHTHTFKATDTTNVEPAGEQSFGQAWHGIEFDQTSKHLPSPTVTISLPLASTPDTDSGDTHMKYELRARQPNVSAPMWIFQVPTEVVGKHKDIFNPRATSLFLALAQTAGAVASLNFKWSALFVAESERHSPSEHSPVDGEGVTGGE